MSSSVPQGGKAESGLWIMNVDRPKKNALQHSWQTGVNQVVQKINFTHKRNVSGVKRSPLSASTSGQSPTVGNSPVEEEEATIIQNYFKDIPDDEQTKAALIKLREILYTTKCGYAMLGYESISKDGEAAKDLSVGSSSLASLASDDSSEFPPCCCSANFWDAVCISEYALSEE